MASVWINGQLLDDIAASVSIRDTGLLHAAGVFTTMRATEGRVIRLTQHLLRLRGSCGILAIPLPYSDGELTTAIEQLLRQNQLADARLRLTVTRGAAGPAPAGGTSTTGSVFLTANAFQPYPQELYSRGMRVALSDQKLNPYDIQAGHKTLNYLSRLAALEEARQRGGDESIWEDVRGSVQSGSIGNIFIVKGGRLLTPPTGDELVQDSSSDPASAVLPGITRGLILELAGRLRIAVERCAIDRGMLMQADECFLSNSLMGVMPVCQIQQLAVGDGNPGELTTQLMRMYEKASGGEK